MDNFFQKRAKGFSNRCSLASANKAPCLFGGGKEAIIGHLLTDGNNFILKCRNDSRELVSAFTTYIGRHDVLATYYCDNVSAMTSASSVAVSRFASFCVARITWMLVSSLYSHKVHTNPSKNCDPVRRRRCQRNCEYLRSLSFTCSKKAMCFLFL